MAVPLSTYCFHCMPLIMLLVFFFPSQSVCVKFAFGPQFIVPDPSPQSPEAIIAPAPTSGGDLPRLPSERFRASSPSAGYSFGPLEPASGPAPSDAPSTEPDGGVPFINSNPAVPLPSDITDTASFLPLPSRGNDPQVGGGALMQIHILVVVVVMIFSLLASA